MFPKGGNFNKLKLLPFHVAENPVSHGKWKTVFQAVCPELKEPYGESDCVGGADVGRPAIVPMW